MDKIQITGIVFILLFGFMLGWLFTIYIAGRFDTFGIAANWQHVSEQCFAAADAQGKLLDRISKSNEEIEQKLQTGSVVKNGK